MVQAKVVLLEDNHHKRILSLGVTHEELYSGHLAKLVPYHFMYGKEYCTTSLALYTEEEVGALKTASEKVEQIYQKVLRFAQNNLPDTYLEHQLGIHPSLITTARMRIPFQGVIRQDWIVSSNGLKVIESNTDTATGMPECTYLSEAILRDDSQFRNPSQYMKKHIKQAFSQLIEHYRNEGFRGKIVFSCYEWHEEDYCNTKLLLEQVRKLGYDPLFAPLDKLTVIPGDGLYYNGEKIDIWYRLYPLEYLVHDEDETGFKTGEEILRLITAGQLAIINPIQSIITQSKGFMALVWSLFELNETLPQLLGVNKPLFTHNELQSIQQYFLPTYFDNDQYFKENNIPFVEKAMFGREGKGTIINQNNEKVTTRYLGISPSEREELIRYYKYQPKIFQEYFPMEKVELQTEGDKFEGYLLTGVYVIGGKYSGLLPRVGEKVTDDLAYFCPAVMVRK